MSSHNSVTDDFRSFKNAGIKIKARENLFKRTIFIMTQNKLDPVFTAFDCSNTWIFLFCMHHHYRKDVSIFCNFVSYFYTVKKFILSFFVCFKSSIKIGLSSTKTMITNFVAIDYHTVIYYPSTKFLQKLQYRQNPYNFYWLVFQMQ